MRVLITSAGVAISAPSVTRSQSGASSRATERFSYDSLDLQDTGDDDDGSDESESGLARNILY